MAADDIPESVRIALEQEAKRVIVEVGMIEAILGGLSPMDRRTLEELLVGFWIDGYLAAAVDATKGAEARSADAIKKEEDIRHILRSGSRPLLRIVGKDGENNG